jgi:hypothetical protein
VLSAGETTEQAVQVTIAESASARWPAFSDSEDIRINLGGSSAQRLPLIGLGLDSRSAAASLDLAAMLREVAVQPSECPS